MLVTRFLTWELRKCYMRRKGVVSTGFSNLKTIGALFSNLEIQYPIDQERRETYASFPYLATPHDTCRTSGLFPTSSEIQKNPLERTKGLAIWSESVRFHDSSLHNVHQLRWTIINIPSSKQAYGSLKRDRLPVIIVNRINSCDEIKHVLNYSSEERQTIQEDYSPFFEPKLTFEHFEASRQIPPVHFLYRPPLLYITMDWTISAKLWFTS